MAVNPRRAFGQAPFNAGAPDPATTRHFTIGHEPHFVEFVQQPGESLGAAANRALREVREAHAASQPEAHKEVLASDSLPIIDLVEINGVWMTAQDARDAAASRASP